MLSALNTVCVGYLYVKFNQNVFGAITFVGICSMIENDAYIYIYIYIYTHTHTHTQCIYITQQCSCNPTFTFPVLFFIP